jgi:hypothetical protein
MENQHERKYWRIPMKFIKTLALVFAFVLPWLWGLAYGPSVGLVAWTVAICGLSISILCTYFHARYLRCALLFAALISVAFAMMQFVGWAELLVPWISESTEGQAYANLRQRNQFASLCVMGWLALLIGLHCDFVKRQTQADSRRRDRITMGEGVAWVWTAWLAWGVAMSSSRTGALQWMAVLVLVVIWRKSLQLRVLRLAIVGLACYALWVAVMPWAATAANNASAGLLGRLDDTNALSRVVLWSNVWELIMREPWIGHGWRSLAYAHYSTNFSGPRFMELLDNAHNLPLHLAVELGLPVALGFCSLVAWLLWKNQPWKETRPQRQLAWGVLLVIGIHSMVEYPLWYGPFFMTTMICVGILAGDIWQKWLLSHSRSAQSAIIFGVRGFGVLLLLGTAYVAFDYHRVSQIYLTDAQRSPRYTADPLGAAKQSVLFQNHAKFAELQITPLTRESAARVLELSAELVRWSPEPRIIEKLIESSVMMGQDDLAAFHLKHYKLAYPAAHASWIKSAL